MNCAENGEVEECSHDGCWPEGIETHVLKQCKVFLQSKNQSPSLSRSLSRGHEDAGWSRVVLLWQSTISSALGCVRAEQRGVVLRRLEYRVSSAKNPLLTASWKLTRPGCRMNLKSRLAVLIVSLP
jgi:hypothetical protein